jgi:transcriptional regulator with XRE-family HTH domain
MSNALQRIQSGPRGLKALRVAHRLTQRQLAQRAGVNPSQIAHLERGLYPAVWRRLVRICDALNVSADEILGREPVTPVVDALAREDRELLDAMESGAIAFFGENMLKRIGGWRRIARVEWPAHLIGARDQLLRRPRNDAPMLEAANATAIQRRHFQPNAKGPLRLPAGMEPAAPPPVPQPAFPKNWFKGWESPRQAAMRLNLPAPMSPRHLTAQQAAARRRLMRGAV